MDSIIGYIAAVLTTMSLLPQALRTHKTKSTNDLSPLMYLVSFVGIICWLIYGFILGDLPMILANAVTSIFAGYILFVIVSNKLKYKN